MTSIWHDFSRHDDLRSPAIVVGAVTEAARQAGIPCIIAGAFARDLHLQYRWRVPATRATSDIDFAFSVADWPAFDGMKRVLTARFGFTETNAVHRLRFHDGQLIDIVPFGGVETPGRELRWPPDGNPLMNAFGFREALASACTIRLPGGVDARLVSLPALALLKIVCWSDRHLREPGKDAADLRSIIEAYLAGENHARLFEEFNAWTSADDFEFQDAEARMLGHDMRLILAAAGIARIDAVHAEQCDEARPGALPVEMNRGDPDRARRQIAQLRRGLRDGRVR